MFARDRTAVCQGGTSFGLVKNPGEMSAPPYCESAQVFLGGEPDHLLTSDQARRIAVNIAGCRSCCSDEVELAGALLSPSLCFRAASHGKIGLKGGGIPHAVATCWALSRCQNLFTRDLLFGGR